MTLRNATLHTSLLLGLISRVALTQGSATTVSAPCDAASIRRAALASSGGLVGRYGADAGARMLIVARCGDSYAVQPVVSGNPAFLAPAGVDTFAFQERPEREIAFRRTRSGGIDAITRVGTGEWLERVAAADTQLVEHILAGRTQRAVVATSRPGATASDVAAIASRILSTLPSMRANVLAFLSALAPRHSTGPLAIAYGDALASVGRLNEAHAAYRRAATTDSLKGALASRLRMTSDTRAPIAEGWTVPFDLRRVFDAPTAREKGTVLADWKARLVQPTAIEEVYRMTSGNDSSVTVVLSFRLGALREYGAVILPAHAMSDCCAVVVDIKGTTPDYQPLEIGPQLTRSVRELGAARRDAIIALPGVRGERLVVGGREFVSEGDRRDGWDGAADDARALLSAVLAHYPQADARRVCAFGHSRGATVALLAAERDSRFGCVVAEAAPVDWFTQMTEDGWSLPAAIAEGLTSRSKPGAIGGQFIERFLAPAIDGVWSLEQVRHRMLASSPLYFADRLPPTLAIYGIDDASVSIGNGRALSAAFDRLPKRRGLHGRIQPAVGHDLDPVDTPVSAGHFLRDHLHLGAGSTSMQSSTEGMAAFMSTFADADRFAGTVLVAEKGRVIFQRSYGMANREWGIANDSATIFRIGSISKQFTALGLLTLQDRGVLSMNDALCAHVSACPPAWRKITLHHLLTHASGIPDVVRLPDFPAMSTQPTTLDRTIARFRSLPLEFPPGSAFRYGNSGYILAARIIERASGMSYERFMRQVYDGIGLAHTGYAANERIIPHSASGYVRDRGSYARASYIDMTVPVGAGAEYSSVGDFLAYDQALYANRPSAGAVAAMFTDYGHGYGYGWEIGSRWGETSYSHVGDINGFGAYVARYPARELLVVVLSNLERSPVQEINEGLARRALGR